MVFFKEPATAARIACIIAIVGGIVGLKLLHNTSEAG
jgi:multidrug transporter EmrE-like cation transporter